MRNAKLWSVLLAAVLLCACVVGVLFTGASAGGVVTYGVNYTDGIDADKQYDTIDEVFEAVEAAIENGEWIEGDTLEIKFAGSIEAKVNGSELVFGQKTIFTSVGKKLPITIKGTEENKASEITVTADRIACANDYTFENLKLDVNTANCAFFAGSGQVTLKDLANVANSTATASSAAKGRLYGDNYTAEAYAGWTKADMEALMDEDHTILTSLTFSGFNYYGANNNSYSTSIAAVGASHDTDNYSAVAADDASFVITPASTKAKIHWMSGTTYRLGGYNMANPARVHTAYVWATGGTVAMMTGDDSASIKNVIVNGNIDVKMENLKMSATLALRVLHGSGSTITNTSSDPAEYGNVNVYAKNVTYTGSAKANEYYLAGSDNTVVDGKVTVLLDNCKANHPDYANNSITFIGLAGKQGVENTIKNTNLHTYSATRISAKTFSIPAEIKNVFENVIQSGATLNLSGYSTHNNANVSGANFSVKSITNVFTGCTFSGANIYAAGSATSVDTLNTTIDSCDISAKEFLSISDSSTANPQIKNVTITLKETVKDKTTSFMNGVFYGYYGSSNATKITGNLEINVEGGSYDKFIGVYGKTVGGKVINNFKGGTIVTAYYGAYNSTAAAVENHLTGGTLKGVNGTYNESGKLTEIAHVLNRLDGANTSGFNGVYRTKVAKVENYVTAGTHINLYMAFGHQDVALGDVINHVSGGTVSGDYLSAYGGTSVKSVTNNISGTVRFTNSAKMFCGAPGNDNWPSKVLGNVINNISGGTFAGIFYGGARSGNVCGDVINNIKSATFNATYYGGNFAPVYYRSGYTYYQSFNYKGIEGTIYNNIGEDGKPDTAPVFNAGFYGGDRGDTSAKAYANRTDCAIVNTIYNGTFNGNYTGANGASAYRTTHSDQTPYSITLDVTNNVHGGTFKGNFIAGEPYNGFIAAEGEVVATVSQATITNNIYGGTFKAIYFGGHGSTVAPMNVDVINHFYGGTLEAVDNYLGHGNFTTSYGTITNIFEEGFKADSAYVYGAGGGTVYPAEGETIAVKNIINGGTFTGFWGAGGNAHLVVNGDIVTDVYGGTFNSYGSVSNQINAIAGGARNGTMNCDTTLNIYGGTFNGMVNGGTHIGSTDYLNRHVNGATELNIYGGTFKKNIYACSFYESIRAIGGSTLNIIPTEGRTIAIFADVENVTLIDATAGVSIDLGKSAYLGADALIGTLKLNQTEAWLPSTYAKVFAANAVIEYTQSEDVVGACEIVAGDATVLRGVGGIEIRAASLLISDRIQIKLMFAENEINALEDGFEFTFKTHDGTVMGTVNKEKLGEAKDGYYSYLLTAMGLGDFDRTIVCTGTGLYRNNISVIGLANMGVEYYTTTQPNETYAALFASIANLGSTANGGALLHGTEPAIKDVDFNNWNTTRDEAAAIQLNSMSLIMTDAIGVRYKGYTTAADTPIKVFSGDQDVTDFCVIKRASEATEGVYTFTVDIYINVSSMTSELPIKIGDGASDAFSMNLRIDALAEKVVEADSSNLVSKCALAYIQAADAYKNPVA